MTNKLLSRLVGSAEKKRLVSNIFSLSVLQGMNYVLPLLTFPYLVRVLGPEYFGLIAFAAATIGYFLILTDYGFNLSATRLVSVHREDKAKIDEIFSSVMIVKMYLVTLSFILFSSLVICVEKFNQHWELYFVTFGLVIGQMLFPVWLFQGLEKMKYIAILSVMTKVFSTVGVFVFVDEKSDYLLVPLLTSVGVTVAGVVALYLAFTKFNVSFRPQKWGTLNFYLCDAWHIFFSSLAMSVYTISCTFMLGIFTSNTIVGYFSSADKIIQAVKGMYVPISQSIYPLISKKVHESKRAAKSFIEKITRVICGGMFFVSLLLFLSSEVLVMELLGENYQESIMLVKVMAFLPFIISLSNMSGIQTMLTFGFKKEFSHILSEAAILGLCLSLTLITIYHELGAAISLLLIETYVAIRMKQFVYKKINKC